MTKFKQPGHCGVLVVGHRSELLKNDTKHLMLGRYGDWIWTGNKPETHTEHTNHNIYSGIINLLTQWKV